MLDQVVVQHIRAHAPLHRSIRLIGKQVSQTGPGVIAHHTKIPGLHDELDGRGPPGCALASMRADLSDEEIRTLVGHAHLRRVLEQWAQPTMCSPAPFSTYAGDT